MMLHDYRLVCPNYRLFTAGQPGRRCLHHGRVWNVVRHHCMSDEGSRWRKVAAGAEAGPVGHCGGMPAFLYAGRLVAEKGLDVLLEAARSLPPGVKVVLLGTGRLEGTLRARVKAERLPIEVRGFASCAVVGRQLAGATAALLPALWYENCPMAVLEAAAQGVPVVTSAIGGISELVSDEVTGLLVPPGDAPALAAAMQRLAVHPERAAQLGAAAWHRARAQHDPQDRLAALLDCYVRVIR